MIRFFRKIRLELIVSSRFGKYLIYALGETILVVIGILIALEINNRNEQSKKEEKVELILNDIVNELKSDINESFQPLNYFAERDSTIFLVLNEQVSIDDYKNNSLPYINYLTVNYDQVNLTQNGYDILKQNLDAVPDQFNPIIEDLDNLYNYYKKFLSEATSDISSFILENQYYAMRNYPWYYGRNEEERLNKIQFMLSDWRYKNEVNEYLIAGIGNQLRWSVLYRKRAIECYQKISKLLKIPEDKSIYEFNPDIAELLIGNWYLNDNKEITFRFYSENNRLFVDSGSPNSNSEVYYIQRYNKIFIEYASFGTLVINDEESILKFNNFQIVKQK